MSTLNPSSSTILKGLLLLLTHLTISALATTSTRNNFVQYVLPCLGGGVLHVGVSYLPLPLALDGLSNCAMSFQLINKPRRLACISRFVDGLHCGQTPASLGMFSEVTGRVPILATEVPLDCLLASARVARELVVFAELTTMPNSDVGLVECIDRRLPVLPKAGWRICK